MSYANFKASLVDFFVEQKYCDVQFVLKDDASDSAGIMAHKLILSMASDVFHTMFYGEAAKQENLKQQDKKPIQIDDIKFSTFKLLLSFIYNDTVEFDTPETIVDFYYAAHKYNCLDALDFIKNYILEELNADNSIFFFSIANLYDCAALQEACMKIFSENTREVLSSEKFLNAEPTIVETIFKLDALNIKSDKELIEALERYIEHNIDNDKGIPEKVRPTLSQIRFLTLTSNEVAETTLLKPEDVVAVVRSLPPNGDFSKMPTFLSKNSNKRKMTVPKKLEMIRKLSDVYTTNYCMYCGTSHAIWKCPNGALDAASRTTLKNIYSKYNHVCLMDYEPQDIMKIFEAYEVYVN